MSTSNKSIISREKLFEKLEYVPHSQEQWDAHNAEERFRIACCGRRWGKSLWAGHEVTYKMFTPHSINWIVGPNYTLGEKEFRVVLTDFKKLGILSECKVQNNVNQGNMRIYFPQLDSLVEVKSADKQDGLVGERLNHVCMSEAAKHRKSTWEMYIQPGLADVRGTADFPSTPEGFNWYEAMYRMGQSEEDVDYKSWRLPSWTNPIVYPGGINDPEITRLRREVSNVYFQQEIAAEFTVFEGKIYDEFNELLHVRPVVFDPQWKNFFALDFGYVDPFVCLDVAVDKLTGRIYVWREYQVSGKATSEHAFDIRARDQPEGYHIDAVFGDPRGADELATLQLIWGGIGEQHDVGRELGYEAIHRAMKPMPDGIPGLVIDPSCTDLIRQMRNLRRKEVREGHNEKPGQHDYDDHGPDALRYFFNEYIVLGSQLGISDLYGDSLDGSESESFFNANSLSRTLGIDRIGKLTTAGGRYSF